MDWTPRQCEGFALAAAARGDRGAALAARGLSPAVAELAMSVAGRMGAAEPSTRRAWVRTLLTGQAPVRQVEDAVPPRVLGLLAPSVDKALGRRWLEQSPLPRAGYVADPRLLSLLAKLVARPPD